MALRSSGKAYSAIQPHVFRRSLTFKTTSGRSLTITKGTPTITTQDCDCSTQFPQGLRIDHGRPLINTVASYNQHIVIASGTNDWPSRIETDEGAAGAMAKTLKDMLGVKGDWFDPKYSTLINSSSFQPPESPNETATSVHLFPHFLHFPRLTESPVHPTHLLSTYLNPLPSHSARLPPPPPSFAPPQPITKPTIFICSHATRDMRCGILGPRLYASFLTHAEPGSCDVGMISHVGGHAWAGNVIVYIPPNFTLGADGAVSPLAGMGIWYGRVERRHVPLIMEETVGKGRVIGDLWRGGLDAGLEGGWRERTMRAKAVRVPAGLLQQDGDVVEGEEEREPQDVDARSRVGRMGWKARRRWNRGP
ncbi:MAG: hypothetical protein LQ344_007473 [Seirophora lacunosa]|nr:MAG: hypothetical protein LQ344_007473 [Seirophora lacunosa]